MRPNLFSFITAACFSIAPMQLHAQDSGEPGVVTKVGNAVERGAHAAADGVEHGARAAANGIEKGAKATEHGVKRGVQATANGVKRAAQATQETADHVADKIGRPSESSDK